VHRLESRSWIDRRALVPDVEEVPSIDCQTPDENGGGSTLMSTAASATPKSPAPNSPVYQSDAKPDGRQKAWQHFVAGGYVVCCFSITNVH